jgi:hypothetical protein
LSIARGREIPRFGVIGALFIIDAFDQFGNQKVQIHITLAMGLGG